MREHSHSGARTRRGGRALVLSAAGALALLAASGRIDAAQPPSRSRQVVPISCRTCTFVSMARSAAAGQAPPWPARGMSGDGRGDVVVGAPQETARGRSGSGSAYVIFGTESPTTVDLAQVGARGFRIDGAADGDRLGTAVGGAGDVNGDGLRRRRARCTGGRRARAGRPGTAFVVFGRRETSAAVDLAGLGGRVSHRRRGGTTPARRSPARDVNGDGRADVVVGAPRAGNNARPGSGSAHVVFGTARAAIDLAALGGAGFRIDGAAALDNAGAAVAGAGDVNGDGRADVVVGAPQAGNNARPGSGSAHVVFGTARAAAIDLAALGAPGSHRRRGGARQRRRGGRRRGGRQRRRARRRWWGRRRPATTPAQAPARRVVFGTGQAAAIDLAALGGAGFRIDGARQRRRGGGRRGGRERRRARRRGGGGAAGLATTPAPAPARRTSSSDGEAAAIDLAALGAPASASTARRRSTTPARRWPARGRQRRRARRRGGGGAAGRQQRPPGPARRTC